jgi:hypothetical protein
VDAETLQFLAMATLSRPGLRRRILDVQSSYYLGDVAHPEDGGRVLCPDGLFIVSNLAPFVWGCVLRWAYLLTTIMH